jgi:hypothetical protein
MGDAAEVRSSDPVISDGLCVVAAYSDAMPQMRTIHLAYGLVAIQRPLRFLEYFYD